eukprot:GHRR01025829.1.p3 GENE.GHRR01025829.1~~GHRR01025829.1.p3  ORF type:complete len:119 (-),score=29.64 GHRR01025829.1:841-1197(-)
MLQVKKMKAAGYELGNLDATIIAQKPKLSPHKVCMRNNFKLLNMSALPPWRLRQYGYSAWGCKLIALLLTIEQQHARTGRTISYHTNTAATAILPIAQLCLVCLVTLLCCLNKWCFCL